MRGGLPLGTGLERGRGGGGGIPPGPSYYSLL